MARFSILPLVVFLAACAGASSTPAPVVIHAGDAGTVNLPAGRYTVSWRADCTSFFVEWAPTSGAAPVEIPVAAPSGSATVDLPAGPAYVNRGGSCPNGGTYDVTIASAAGG